MPADGRVIALTRRPADRNGARPAVLLLHGNRGFDSDPRAYDRHAQALTAKGMDAYLVRYFSPTDATALDPRANASDARDAYRTGRFRSWATDVSAVITALLQRPECSGRIGVLGFSLGGYVAAATAATDGRVAALAVMYGGMPDAFTTETRHLPPLLAIHGDADAVVPLGKAEGLVALAKRAGTPAELIVYPGKGHGFDFSATDPAAKDAIERVGRFFASRLEPTPDR